MRTRLQKPASNPLTDAAEYCTQRLLDTVTDLSRPLEPLGKRRIGPAAQLERYEQMRGNPQEWQRLLADRGPVQVATYIAEMERLRAERSGQSRKEA